MEKNSAEPERRLCERLGRDSVVAPPRRRRPARRAARPSIENDAFYIAAYLVPNKMRRIAAEAQAALVGD